MAAKTMRPSCFENVDLPVLKTPMAITREKLVSLDPVWAQLRAEAETMAIEEPALAGFIHGTILKHDRLESALSYLLARKLGGGDIDPLLARETFEEALAGDAGIGEAIRADLSAVFERDPACHSYVEAFLYYKGFHALECYRIGHWLWGRGRHALALFFQSRISELFAVDIHPAARLGRGIMIDHATGVVIGETAVVEDDVSMLHGVTLGGTGKGSGDRRLSRGSKWLDLNLDQAQSRGSKWPVLTAPEADTCPPSPDGCPVHAQSADWTSRCPLKLISNAASSR